LLTLENLQIRINQINTFLTELEKNPVRSKALDFAHLPDFIDKSNSFEVNQQLERLRLNYNKKYGKQIYQGDLVAATNVPKSYETEKQVPVVEDNAPESLENRVELMKKGFEEKKKNKEGIPILSNTLDNENSKEDEQKAIDEVKDLYGVINNNAPDFDVLLSNTQRKIALNSITEVKEGLQKEFIGQWNNWESLNFNAYEERKIRSKMEATQRRLKQFLEEKNTFDEQRNGTAVTLTADETIVAKEIKNSVVNNLRNYLHQDILQEVNYQMSFRLNDELRTFLYKSYEKEKKNTKNTSPDEIKENIHAEHSIAADEQQTNISITLYPLKPNVGIPLNGIYFKANTADILPESEAELMRLQQFLEVDNFRVIELSAHTHGHCSASFADLITQQRLQNLKKVLINRDIAENRIWLRPFGKNAPLAPNNTLEGRILNQRIEMKLINK
jgi:outer membrane protein OmpA-like peptidoglycan-associated protein